MGLSFLSLLYLQVSYIEEMVKMRNEQFDESVKRSLYQVSKNLEYDETLRYLEKDVAETERIALASQTVSPAVAVNNKEFVAHSPHYSAPATSSDFELKTTMTKPSGLPKAMISRKHGENNILQTSKTLQEAIKNRYLHQRVLLDEVVLNILYKSSDKSLDERVSFKNLDGYLKSEFVNNGIDIPYHFTVTD